MNHPIWYFVSYNEWRMVGCRFSGIPVSILSALHFVSLSPYFGRTVCVCVVPSRTLLRELRIHRQLSARNWLLISTVAGLRWYVYQRSVALPSRRLKLWWFLDIHRMRDMVTGGRPVCGEDPRLVWHMSSVCGSPRVTYTLTGTGVSC